MVLIVVVGADPDVVVPEPLETIPPVADALPPPPTPDTPSLSENIAGVGEGPDRPTSDIFMGPRSCCDELLSVLSVVLVLMRFGRGMVPKVLLILVPSLLLELESLHNCWAQHKICLFYINFYG